VRGLLALLLLVPLLARAQTVTGGAASVTTLISSQVAVVGNGADTTEDTLFTVTIPAGTFVNVGDAIHIIARGTNAASTDTKSVRVKFGGSNSDTFNTNIVGQTTWYIDEWLWKTGTNTQAWTAFHNLASNSGSNGFNSNLAITDTAAITLLITGQNSTAATANSIQTSAIMVWAVH